jgi:xanthine dehydrogenase YagR molybdenum-binding subunit
MKCNAHSRVDGDAKVTGSARFASDVALPGLVHAAVVTSHIARGRIIRLELADARSIRGVLGVFTHHDLSGMIAHVPHLMAGGYVNSSALPLGSDEIRHAGQIVALVVAETSESADEAAARVVIEYEADSVAMDLDARGVESLPLSAVRDGYEDVSVGDAASAYTAAPVKIDASYRTPIQHHNPLELFTTTCAWAGMQLTVYEPTRYVGAVKHGLAQQLGIDASNIRVMCPFIGGHFGSKLALPQYTALIAWAARRIGRPVRFIPTRAQCFTIANHRPMTRHRIRLGALLDGTFTALFHDAESSTSRFDNFAMEGTDVTASLYGIDSVQSSERIVRIDSNTPGPMRAPPEVPFLFALESAVDELAATLEMDPIELRRVNDTAVDRISGKPFTPRMLMACFDAGAAAFGWDRTRSEQRRRREDNWLIGSGCASAVRPAKVGPALIRVVLTDEGRFRIETAHHEIGNGLYTVLATEAANKLGVAVDKIDVLLGDTALPPAGLSGGSSTTGSLIPALHVACGDLIKRIDEITCTSVRLDDPLSVKECLTLAGSREIAAMSHVGRDAALDKLRVGKIALSSIDELPRWAYGAQFAEVRVHAHTGEVRVSRLLGAFAPGRVVNQMTALSQLRGAMVWGIGSALLEHTLADGKSGRYINDNLAEYLVATCADAAQVEALIVPTPDEEELPLMGLGEIGIIGVNAAIANAVCHASGVRLRRLPIRIEDVMQR